MDIIFNKKRLRQLRTRCLKAEQADAKIDFLTQHSATILSDRLSDIKRRFDTVLYIGFGKDIFCQNHQFKKIIHFDIAQSPHLNVQGDIESLPFAAHSFDLVVANMTLHHVNDLPGALIQIQSVLKPDGLFLGALSGEESLIELRQSMMQTEIEIYGGASPRIMPMVDMRDMGGLMQRAKFALPVIDKERLCVTYPNAFKLMAELRGMGEANCLNKQNKKIMRRDFFPRACTSYAHQFAEDDGRIPARFDIIYVCGWHPHESQQKPLKPGSADISLVEFLS